MKYIGNHYERVDGAEKINGTTKYVDDYTFPNMLYISVLRSPIAHGKILSLDTSKAYINGVHGIYTGKDFPGDNSYGFPVCDNTILSKGEVKYIGDAVAIVCAESKKIADESVKLINVNYQKLESIFDVNKSTNLLNRLVIKKNIEAFEAKEENISLELNLSTKHQEHMYIEPEGAVATFDNGKLTVYAPMQSPMGAKGIMCKIMALLNENVRIIQSTVGGGFGGKDDVVYEACGFASLGAYKTERPCKYIASREESIISSYKRHPMHSKINLICDKEGNLKSIKVRTKMDGGAYASVSNFVQYRNTTHSAGPYIFDSVDVENEVFYTNNVYCGAFRGFGGLQACFFYDTAIDEMSYKLNMDPIDFRLKNSWRKGATTSTNQLINFEPSINQILNRIRKASNWDEKRKEFSLFNSTNKYYRKGIGVALGYHGISLGAEGDDFAQSELIYDKSKEKFVITSGITELGQGARTVFSQIVSEVLEIPKEFIEVNNYDTDVVLDSGPTVASRGSTVGGKAVQIASQNFIKFIKENLLKDYQMNYKEIEYAEGKFSIKGKTFATLTDYCKKLSQRCDVKAFGRYDMPKIDWNEHNGLGIPYVAYHYGAHICYITIDMVTGMISVDKYFAIHDIGKVINPAALKGQINGGIATGIGYSLMEDLDIHEGIIENRNFDSYLIPTSEDIPEICSEAFESIEPLGPYGAKGTGEPVLTPVPACIGNAIRFATGKRITELPFSLEKIVLGKELKRYGK